MEKLEELAFRISERVQSVHWGKCRCRGCRNMVTKRASIILEELRVVRKPDLSTTPEPA